MLLAILVPLGGAGYYFRETVKTEVFRLDPVSDTAKNSLRGLLLNRDDVSTDLISVAASTTSTNNVSYLAELAKDCMAGDAPNALFEARSDDFDNPPFSISSGVELYKSESAATRSLAVFDDAGNKECFRQRFREDPSALGENLSFRELLSVEVSKDPTISLPNRLVITGGIITTPYGDRAVRVKMHIIQRDRIIARVISVQAAMMEAISGPEDPNQEFYNEVIQASLDAVEGRIMGTKIQ